MKKIYFILTTLITSITTYAQVEKVDYITRIMQSAYIFEGQVISSTPYYNAANDHIYTSNTIQISKIFKGALECGTIEIITEGGTIDDLTLQPPHTMRLREGVTGIFLCNTNNKELSSVDFFVESNPEKLEASYDEQSLIKYLIENQQLKAFDLWGKYDIGQITNLVQYATQITITDCGNNLVAQINNNNNQTYSEPVTPYQPQQMPNYSNADYILQTQMIQQLKTSAVNEPDRMAGNLDYTFQNFTITGTNPHYMEFDIAISDNISPSYFAAGKVFIQYNPSEFGPTIVANNKIQITPGTLINNPANYSAPTPQDLPNNVVAIPFSPASNLGTLSDVPSTPTQLAHVKIEILNCLTNASIEMVDNASTTSNSIYSVTSSLSTFQYSTASIIGTTPIPACVPTITTFSPMHVGAGVGAVLSIKGFLLGANSNGKKIFFPNSSDGGLSNVKIDQTNIISWSDTLVKIRLFSVDTGTDAIGNIDPNTSIGSGKFRIRYANNDSAVSPNNIEIWYSVMNLRTSSVNNKARVNLIKTNNDGGYYFHVDTAIYNHPERLACVRFALKNWSCISEVRWKILKDTVPYTNTYNNDTINMIQFGTVGSPDFQAQLVPKIRPCGLNKSYMAGMDLIINENKPWVYDTTGIPISPTLPDFYAAVLHELGHGHALFHVIDSLEIMHFQVRHPNSTAPRKIALYNNYGTVIGAQDIMDFSKVATYASCSKLAITPFLPPLCNFFNNGILENENLKYQQLKVYPNPFQTTITFELENVSKEPTTISIISLTGQGVIYETINSTTQTLVTQIDVANLKEGFYFIEVKNGSNTHNGKIIKQ
jgi:hypothetical protein